MFLLFALAWLAAMIFTDWRDVRRESPRPTRIKLAYGLLVLIVLYHSAVILKWVKAPDFHDTVRAVIGAPANAVWNWFR
jgi:hypothetical protein